MSRLLTKASAPYGGRPGRWIGPLVGVLLFFSTGIFAAGTPVAASLTNVRIEVPVARDTVPPAKRAKTPDEPFPATTEREKARAGLIVKHTNMKEPPPDSDEAERQRFERNREAEQRKAEELAAKLDRLERRRVRLLELNGGVEDMSRSDRRKLARQERAERKREAERLKAEREREEALAAREAKRARIMAEREAERKERELEEAKALAERQAKERQRAAEEAKLLAEREAAQREELEKRRAEAERQALLDEQMARERRERELAELERAKAAREAQRIARENAPPPPPQLSPQERAAQQRAARERMKRLNAERVKAEKAARIAYRAGRADRKAARRKALRDASAARAAARQARRQALAQRRAEKNEQRYRRLAERKEKKAALLAERRERTAAKALARAERRQARNLIKSERLAERNARKAERLARLAVRKAARDLRRSDRMAAREARRADRMARREARRARRLARREARRLRRLQNPPYWTAEPAIVIALPARSGGPSDEKSLEAITVQALAGYHRARGLSVRSGMAFTVINSKVSAESTTTETITRTGVVRIIQNPDGSRTEETGPIQIRQTVTKEERYFNRLSSIDFPLLVGYRFQGNKYGLMAELGPSLNLSSGGEAHVRAGEGFRAVGGGHFLGRRAGIGFLMQLTGEYRLSETAALVGGLRVQSFGGAFEDPEVAGVSTKVTTVGLSLGYRLRF